MVHSIPPALSGLIRDYEESWLLGFNKHLGIFSILEAELWRILEGLRLAWLHRFERVQCQTDSSEAYDLITSLDASSSSIYLVRAIADYSSKSWMLDYVLIKRETNFVADLLAKSYPALDGSTSIYYVAPTPLLPILVKDLHGPYSLDIVIP
ncbi:hypothetical protein GQ457_13G018960 [Hibiscus cannabinus]